MMALSGDILPRLEEEFGVGTKLSGLAEQLAGIAHLHTLVTTLERDAIVVVNLSGRGDKDAEQVREIFRSGDAAAH